MSTGRHATDREPTDPVALAERIAATVGGCPMVARLHAGRYGQVVTYRAGTPIRGVRITDDAVQVQIVVRYPAPISAVDAQIRGALTRLTGRPVALTVADIALPGGAPATPASENTVEIR